MIKTKSSKKVCILLISMIIISPVLSLVLPKAIGFFKQSSDINVESDLNLQDVSDTNVYSGIGAPWNLTHYANRTDHDLGVSFNEGSSDSASIPLGSGWEGYKLDLKTKNLKDNRNWNNGSFNYGPDDGDASSGDDDTTWIQNNFQNWTFGLNDTGSGTNPMSGNYFSNIGGHDCLELRMDHYITNVSGTEFRSYDDVDSCWWNSTLRIPRGKVIDSSLKFDLYPDYLIDFNSWAFSIYINTQRVYSIGTANLKAFGYNSWHTFNIAQDVWINSSRVFPSQLENSKLDLQVVLECIGGGNYSFPTLEQDYQQLHVDNVELIMECEALPSNLDLRVNGTVIQDSDWGKGNVILNGNWQQDDVIANFTANDSGSLGSYRVSFDTNLNLFAKKSTPDSTFETDTSSLGTLFEVENSSQVLWETYAYIAIPTGYIESEMVVNFAEDISITSIATSVEPGINILSQCDTSTPGIMIIPVNTVTSTPDGFWKINGQSPNYCEELLIYSDATGGWEQSNEFLSGDSINITAKITSNSIIAGHIQNTKAMLQIRFPNGSFWDVEKQFAPVEINGEVRFNPFQIPISPPDYEVGEYQVIIAWNNSYSGFGLNESGVIYKTFRVVHESQLIPEQEEYSNILEGSSLNLKVSFNDPENFDAIENALIYTYNFTQPTIKQYFNEISPGFYLLEYDTLGGNAGNNTITIYANSTNYKNNAVNITVDLIKQTTLSVDNTFLQDVSYKSNFTVQFNYTETYGGAGISADLLQTDWDGDHQFKSLSLGVYELICNASGPSYDPGNLYTLLLDVQADKYIPQSIPIRIFINELESQLELFINGTRYFGDELISFEFWQKINVTAKYKDIGGAHLSGASLKLTIGSYFEELDEELANQQYEKVINASDIGLSINYLTVIGNITFYNPQSIRTILEITERLTSLQIYLNGVNRTIDPTLTIPIGTNVNLTVKFLDSGGSHIDNANLDLLGDYMGNLIENATLKQYTILLNASNLDVGVKIITISAQKSNYQFLTEDLRIEIRQINTELRLTSGEPRISIQPGQDVAISVEFRDLDFGGTIIGAQLSYSWQGGTGFLTDPDGDGVYTTILRNVPAGSYTIRISAFAGENYKRIEGFEIALSAIVPIEDLTFYLIAIILAIAVGSALGIYYYLYRTIFRFPKQVRHVKKYRKTLSKEKAPKVDISGRDNSFKIKYQDEIRGASKLYKAKIQKSPEIVDKLAKSQDLENAGE